MPLRVKQAGDAVLGNIRSFRAVLHATRGGALAANIVSGLLIAVPVYFLGRSSLPGAAVDFLIELFLRTKLSLLQASALRVSPAWAFLPYVAATAGSAAVCTFVRSVGRILLLNGALAAAIAGVHWRATALLPFPVGPIAVVALVTAGAVLDDVLERRRRRLQAQVLENRQKTGVDILRHIAHSVNPTIQVAMSPLAAAREFLGERGQLNGLIARRRDGTGETVGDALETAIVGLQQIRGVLEDTERLFGDRVGGKDFEEVDLRDLFESEILPLFSGKKFEIRLDVPAAVRIRLHRTSFIQAIKNIVRNAEVHGFQGSLRCPERPVVRFEARETSRDVVIDCINNGAPFPEGFTTKDFLAFGRKGRNSPGKGLGGAWIGKFVEVHDGSFRVIDSDPVRFRITIPKRRTW
jgi:signal transduction histidine kinase